jgi:hypothetical protein
MKFLLVRFTHGSGGKFLSSVLQTSSVVDHWCATLQSYKHQPCWPTLIDQYIRRSFPGDHQMALRSEPHVPYNCDLYSTSRDRGHDVDLEQYLQHARDTNDYRLLACQSQQLVCNLVFNRPQVPLFCHGMPAVSITALTKRERDWLDRTLWNKHFVTVNDEIIYAPDDVDYCNFTRLPDVIKYKNTSRWPRSHEPRLKQEFVIDNFTRDWYFNPEKFRDWDSQHGIENYLIPLESFFSQDRFQHHIQGIFDRFKLGYPNLDLIETARGMWAENQCKF